ncbi:MAG: gp14 [uncultured marine phage]|uniref:Gp14 n=1 Tax=uncultured marine phage TaxID=707152 RepID=A0A8D9CFB7_9VIRU|nr:MAG: gp14 [uncultured marine phage]
MATPLYKFLKEQGTTFYAFPGAAEDISSAYQNDNYSMDFNKFVLLNIPKQNLSTVDNEPIVFDIDNTFSDNQPGGSVPATFADQLIESLRNYVANHETTIRETRLSTNEYFYDNTQVGTTTEKIFWKWCNKLNLMDVEPAVPQDEYFDNLDEFQRNNENEDDYFPEYLWKERETTEWRFVSAYQGVSAGTFSTPLSMEFTGTTNLKEDDIVTFQDIVNSSLTFLNGLNLTVIESTPAGLTQGQILTFGYSYTSGFESESEGTTKLVYDKLVQYIGEINSVNNVAEANKSYTEVVAHIGDHQGQTPDILFRTFADDNYKPNLEYPILPSQYQPEIFGAENFSSPIRNKPQDYPGDYWGQFDDANYVYETSSGDSLRRSGDYYGIKGDVNNIVIDSDNIDGVGLDFDSTHYAKMNIINKEVSNFDEFNALDVNNLPPIDFEFNAILWYYTATDINGNSATNLYGIEFLNNPDNHENPDLTGVKIPTVKKLVNDGTKDGTSYSFSLNLNFNIINDNVQPSFNPQNINTLFSFDLYNEAMKRLATANDSFNRSLAEHNAIKTQVEDLTQLIYTQTDLDTINNRINSLDNLLRLYSTLQLVTTDTIEVSTNFSTSPPVIELNSKDATYVLIENINTTDLYSTSTGVIPYNINVPDSKNFLVNINNDDTVDVDLPNVDDRLTVVIDRDLDYKQSMDIVIDAIDDTSQNKKLDIYLRYFDGNPNELPIETPLITNIDLPVFFNEDTQLTNVARNWKQKDIDLDINSGSHSINFVTDDLLEIPLVSNIGFQKGDAIYLNNFFLGSTNSTDYSGQYLIDTVATASNSITLDITSNSELDAFADSQTGTFPVILHLGTQSILQSQPFVDFNQGYRFKITRIDADDTSTLQSRYLIDGGRI